MFLHRCRCCPGKESAINPYVLTLEGILLGHVVPAHASLLSRFLFVIAAMYTYAITKPIQKCKNLLSASDEREMCFGGLTRLLVDR